MPYNMQFVGLVCFYREPDAREVLLPDGHDPGPDIDPHFASILVDPQSVLSSTGWQTNQDTERGIYELPLCSLVVEGTDTPGTLDATAQDGALPQLRQINHDFEIDPDKAQTAARMTIRRGKLTVHSVPGGTALMSELVVPHDGTIDVTVTPRDGGPARRLRLAPGTEIMLANMAKHGVYAKNQRVDGHFRIYEKLSVRPAPLDEPQTVRSATPSKSRHWYFVTAQPISLTVSCTNTGCC
jgi:hypothetical protein